MHMILCHMLRSKDIVPTCMDLVGVKILGIMMYLERNKMSQNMSKIVPMHKYYKK